MSEHLKKLFLRYSFFTLSLCAFSIQDLCKRSKKYPAVWITSKEEIHDFNKGKKEKSSRRVTLNVLLLQVALALEISSPQKGNQFKTNPPWQKNAQSYSIWLFCTRNAWKYSFGAVNYWIWITYLQANTEIKMDIII